MNMFAVIQTGGKQYKVKEGQMLKIEKVPGESGKHISFDAILLVASDDDSVVVGRPYVEGASVKAEVVAQGKDKKKIVFRYHSKTRYRKKKGHRQPFTEVKITKISAR